MADLPTFTQATRSIYAGPGTEHLERRMSEGFVWGEVRISDFELRSHQTSFDDRGLIMLFTARFQAALDEAAAELTMMTLPVHDEPGIVGPGGQVMQP